MITPTLDRALRFADDNPAAAQTREQIKKAQRAILDMNRAREERLLSRFFGTVEKAKKALREHPNRFVLERHSDPSWPMGERLAFRDTWTDIRIEERRS